MRLCPAPRVDLPNLAQDSKLYVLPSNLRLVPADRFPGSAFAPYPSAPGALPLFAGLGFAFRSQARQSAPAESSSLSYGRLLHLLLLPTPPLGDAVTLNYRPEWACLKGTSALPAERAYGRTSAALQPLMFMFFWTASFQLAQAHPSELEARGPEEHEASLEARGSQNKSKSTHLALELRLADFRSTVTCYDAAASWMGSRAAGRGRS